MKTADPTLPDGWRLEVEAILGARSPAPPQLRPARAASAPARKLDPTEARLHALHGLVLAASGDRAGAAAALAEAERRNPRLARVAELRERLR
jgi:hypothetical protein